MLFRSSEFMFKFYMNDIKYQYPINQIEKVGYLLMRYSVDTFPYMRYSNTINDGGEIDGTG